MPGSIPATSQLDWLISTTTMIVLSWSRATRDLLKSFGWGIAALHQLPTATMVPFPRRLPHTISLLEGGVSCEPVSEKPEIGALSGLNIFQIAPLKRAEEAELEPSSDLMFFKLPP
jgi:hypothetical protein